MPASPATPDAAAESRAARQFRELVDSLDDVIFRFDQHGRWSYLSRAWQTRLGWPIAECLGQAAVRYVHPDERNIVLRNWAEVQAGRQNSYRRELRFRSAWGDYRWMLVSARGLRDDDGVLHSVAGTLTDVSAAKAVEAELIAARAAAEVANKAKSEFLSTMSHELRTPLNAVIGLSESLLEMGPAVDAERSRRYLGIIRSSGCQLLNQINDILDLARIEAGRLKPTFERFDARQLVRAAVEAAHADLAAKSMSVDVQCPDAPVFLHADEKLLRQVMHNLVSNAVKFTGERGRLGVRLEADSGGVVISVTDSGIGIPPEKLSLLFKPFSQVDSSLARKYGGTGLGLVIVDRIVRLHEGSVTVKSTPGQGSTFSVELPFPSSGTASGLRPDRHQSPTILLVDDDQHQRSLVGDYLRQQGYSVVHCEHGADALAAAVSARPALAIVGVALPTSRCLELAARFRETPQGRDLPIIAITPSAEPDVVRRCRAAGINAHLVKPISLALLSQRIESLTGNAP